MVAAVRTVARTRLHVALGPSRTYVGVVVGSGSKGRGGIVVLPTGIGVIPGISWTGLRLVVRRRGAGRPRRSVRGLVLAEDVFDSSPNTCYRKLAICTDEN